MAKQTTTNATDPKTGSAGVTMADLLAQSDYTLRVPKTGNITTGVIKSITKKLVLIDVGGKTEGVVADREYQQAIDFIETLKEGETVDVYVLDGESDSGQILLSLKKAALDKKWDELNEAIQADKSVSVHAMDVNRGGMVVLYEGLRGFIPTSQFGRHITSKLATLKGKNIDVKVIEADREKNRLIFSERQVSEASEIANSTAALQALEEGQVVKGVITGIKPFGLFVAVEVPVENEGEKGTGVLEGLVHVSEVSWDKVDDLNALYKKGQQVEAKVVVVDKNQGKLTLSLKQLQGDPWNDFAAEITEGSTMKGTVSRIVPFGVFVSLKSGIDGLIHESKLGGEVFSEGEEVMVSVDSIDTDQRRVSLSPMTSELPVTYK